MKAWRHQGRAVKAVFRHWNNGIRSVLIVSPAGSGKTVMGAFLILPEDVVLWVAHRRELVFQAQRLLETLYGRENVGVIMAGVAPNPGARIQVGTIETILRRPRMRRRPTLLVLDEAHHYGAPVWHTIVERYPKIRTVGITATPMRPRTGQALGDIFQKLVVAAKYSELIKQGILVPARIIRPVKDLGNDLAMDPVEAWLRFSEGAKTFSFFGRRILAHRYARKFRRVAGIRAEAIEAETTKLIRDDAVSSFISGNTDMLTTVYTMVEGVNVPPARVVLLCRSFGSVGNFIQATGRPLRADEGKRDAIVIDNCGCTIRHGAPHEDREFSLEGTPISGGAPFEEEDDEDEESTSRPYHQSICNVEMVLATPGALPPGAPLPPPVKPRISVRSEMDRELIRRTLKKQGSFGARAIERLL